MPTGVYQHPNRVLGKIETICKYCGKKILAHYSRKKQYCNNKCYRNYIRENRIISPNCKNTGKTRFKKGFIPWNKGIRGIMTGSKNPAWKGGISFDKNHINKVRKEYRHRNGISKKYNSELGISYTKEYKGLQRQKRRALIKDGDKLTIKIIQRVYENNIKRFGTLTCIYCFNFIEFGKDTLEHKIPLSRGGNNDYENLAIACRSCNSKKHNKTYEEFIAIQNGGF